MIYDIRHVTTYEYENPVSFARCTLRLEPRSGGGQELISHEVEIHPRPSERNVRRDFFGTLTESVTIEAAHRNLRIVVRDLPRDCRRASTASHSRTAAHRQRDSGGHRNAVRD